MKPFSELTEQYLLDLDMPTINTNKKITYINMECAFDIETTSTTYNDEKVAFSYIWMLGLGLGNDIFYGRTWKDLLTTLQLVQRVLGLHDERRLVIYVHNLGYEFQFMRKYFTWTSVFAVDERKPIKALCSLGIEFRDSYILSGYSLENTAKNLTQFKVKKMVGDLDYSLIRTPKTPLTAAEMGYCENDIIVVLAYIKEQIMLSGNIHRIPLTNTGRVRSYVKNNCYYDNTNHRKSSKGKYTRYRKIMNDLTLTPETYMQLKTCFMGGFTHSNPEHTNKVHKNVASIDLTSSYPSVMLAEKYPMSRPKELNVTSIDELKQYMNNYCIMFDIKLENVVNTLGYESYISESKCRNLIGAVVNNGRVFEAESLTMTITDVDFNIISKVYKWEKIAIKNVYGFMKNYLPKPIVESILELYQDKTTLKGVEGKEVEYLLSKGMLNSVYGMCVTDVVKDNSVYESNEWGVETVDVVEKITEYNDSKNRFLYYAWGIWVTAYARRNLWTGILAMGSDYIYSDTDSIKTLNYEKHTGYVDWYNKNVHEKLLAMCDHYNLDPELLTPKTRDGIPKPMGVWEFEGNYDMFKTLGAKRYMVLENGKYQLTVAGLSKKNGMDYIIESNDNDAEKIFNAFNDQLYIPADKTGKMTHTYIDDEMKMIITDYLGNTEIVTSKSAIHLEACDFTLSISDQYKQFLRNLSKGYIYKGVKHV